MCFLSRILIVTVIFSTTGAILLPGTQTVVNDIKSLVTFAEEKLCSIGIVKNIIPCNRTSHPDDGASTSKLAESYGYKSEEHTVETEDGFLLTLFHITKMNESSESRPVIFIMHGIFVSSDNWLLLGEKSLGFMLVEAGYDVWLGNFRGNKYSKRHKYLSIDDTAFWDHTFHEIGIYDLPASIDYILDKTNRKQLFYIGFSCGTTSFYVMLSERPEYNDKIVMMVTYAPVVNWNFFPIAPKLLSEYLAPAAYYAVENYYHLAILSFDGPIAECLRKICKVPATFNIFCRPIIAPLVGYNDEEENFEMLPVYVSHVCSTALKILVHYGQISQYHEFRQYKYISPIKNIKKYGSLEPPEYNLKNVQVPVVLLYGNKDPLGNKENTDRLAKVLPNVVVYELVPDENFDHVSFTWGRNAPELVYQRTIELLNNIQAPITQNHNY